MNLRQQDSGRIVGAAVLIGLGLIFLLDEFLDFSFLGQLWPFLIILPGLAFLAAAWAGSEKSVQLAYPGAIVTGTGAILLVQNITGRFESWAYAWALYPVFVGLASMFVGRRTHNDRTYSEGRRTVNTGLILLGIFAVFFEGFIFGGLGTSVGRFLLPAILIGIGLLLLFRGRVPFLQDSFPEKPKFGGPSSDVDPELRRKIDDALTEDEPKA